MTMTAQDRPRPSRPVAPDVLIAGAGPTGLMLALWLTRLGVRVRIADLKPGPVRETRAIALQARSLEFYDQLGLAPEVLHHGRPFDAINVFVRGQWNTRIDLHGVGRDVTPYPYLYIFTQDQNEALLVHHLEALGVTVDWETAVSGVTQDDAGVHAVLSRGDHQEFVRAAYIAACDGARSAVRQALGIALSGGTYEERFYVADVQLGGRVIDGEVNLALDDQTFLATFPMGERGRHRVVGQVPPGAGEHPEFEVVRPQIEASGLAEVGHLHWFSTYKVHHRVADRFQLGRAFILGDAGHVHTPVGGQGMNTGLGDAINLSWKLAQALRGSPGALETYEAERRPFALSLVGTTDRVFTGVVSEGALARFVRLEAVPRLLPLLTRPRPVRRQAFRIVSQTRLHYPDSPLSVGQAGRVRGGTRLPWVPLTEGSNFDVLRSLTWQVHVYGAASPDVVTWCGRRGVPLHVFPWSPAAQRAGLAEDAVYVVRPDGYVGLAQASPDGAALDTYAQRWLAPELDRQEVNA
ncbi:2-polyprenyl-6-methoxyphenol hydroxylase-like FAD-dependent oxidoreductase [Deinococcus metalli]|uniref:2-polyprenyl-6-methoxyphenol hydroxylase n=1 Tax=Deinococcus metalli TaxID=1141878 RepID=A0A7W8KHS6_9DEIO|nr:FAD-dependent monooxygenase [Deinococcus metalli]MBB5378028.1 2-polyprenyl-6-methoxyphenol hydroxylase-like FAD-dependent oxidoreductase [Deinococcus metalli]GHF53868.1 2-polyprenyl-6-methoxyphenol hydroxylase [Deinococcus metalli]